MGAIFYRQFSEGSKPYLTLAGEELVRPLGIGSNWSTLRIAILCAVTPNGVSNITNGSAFFGLCSGAKGFGASDCTNALGWYANNESWAYTSNGGQNFYYAVGPTYAKKVAGVVTTAGSSNMSLSIIGKRACFILTFAKGSPNFSASNVYISATAGGNYATDQTARHAVEWCDTTSTAGPSIILDNTTITATGNNAAVTFNETAGSLDSLNLYWSKAQFPLEIYGIFVAKQA